MLIAPLTISFQDRNFFLQKRNFGSRPVHQAIA